MPDTPLTPVQPAALPWYKSKVMIGSTTTIISMLVVLFPKAGVALGLLSPDAISTAVNSVFEIIGLVAGVFTGAARVASSAQPITATQAQADAHPANKGTTP